MTMGHDYAFDDIDQATFDEILEQYPQVVPGKLIELEEQRLSIIPTALSQRRSDGKPYLTKDETVTLVDWKLSHGTYRPSLKKLVQSNSPDFIEETTCAAFTSQEPLPKRLDILTKLKGIGPATASLLLSTLDPTRVPFFSDELFIWAFWEDRSGSRWDRRIKYSAKEYRELAEKVEQLRARLGNVSALDSEKVAYVLGKRRMNLARGAEGIQEGISKGDEAAIYVGESRKRSKPVDEAKPATKKQKIARPVQQATATSASAPRRSGRNKGTTPT